MKSTKLETVKEIIKLLNDDYYFPQEDLEIMYKRFKADSKNLLAEILYDKFHNEDLILNPAMILQYAMNYLWQTNGEVNEDLVCDEMICIIDDWMYIRSLDDPELIRELNREAGPDWRNPYQTAAFWDRLIELDRRLEPERESVFDSVYDYKSHFGEAEFLKLKSTIEDFGKNYRGIYGLDLCIEDGKLYVKFKDKKERLDIFESQLLYGVEFFNRIFNQDSDVSFSPQDIREIEDEYLKSKWVECWIYEMSDLREDWAMNVDILVDPDDDDHFGYDDLDIEALGINSYRVRKAMTNRREKYIHDFHKLYELDREVY